MYAYWITVNYRESYGMYACNGVLFNHESAASRRDLRNSQDHACFRTYSRSVYKTACILGNMSALRDWGHARDYVEMQWLMLQQDKAEDFVIATGEQHSVREFVEVAANEIGIQIRWEGSGVDEKGYDIATNQCIVAVDPRYFRPAEVETLLGDPSKAKAKLGWVPTTSFNELVEEMMREDMSEAKRDKLVAEHGFKYFKGQE
jgi:GDPmannose 4,6-dehydratase